MTRRRAVIGIALFCALALSALVAPNALALKGTTAFTCKPEPKPTSVTKGFTDEHCTKEAGGALVSFVHEEIKEGVVTPLIATNTETGSKLNYPRFKSTIAGTEFELEAGGFWSCVDKTDVKNLNTAGMFAGGKFCGEFFNVVVNKPAKCEVMNKAVVLDSRGTWLTEVKINGTKEEMRLEFYPRGAFETGPYATFELVGAECALKNQKIEVTGEPAYANVTTESKPDGATLQFTTAKTEEKLKVGENKAAFEGTFTPRMLPTVGQEENPIVLTTTAS
jgi:hypothetical protein